MRTNIEIDDKLMAEALKLTGLPTKKAVVEEGLRLMVRLRQASPGVEVAQGSGLAKANSARCGGATEASRSS